MKSDAVVFDLNNTLRDKSGKPRKHILKKAQKDSKKEDVIIMSGETDKDRPKAENWLKEHDVDYTKLEMRPEGDSEHDDKVKEKLLSKDVSRQFKVKKAYDDKLENVKMFKNHGIKAKKV
jgi:FMN phosphatase YigB (HAD superfamily)